jgi:hypothetical protein
VPHVAHRCYRSSESQDERSVGPFNELLIRSRIAPAHTMTARQGQLVEAQGQRIETESTNRARPRAPTGRGRERRPGETYGLVGALYCSARRLPTCLHLGCERGDLCVREVERRSIATPGAS